MRIFPHLIILSLIIILLLCYQGEVWVENQRDLGYYFLIDEKMNISVQSNSLLINPVYQDGEFNMSIQIGRNLYNFNLVNQMGTENFSLIFQIGENKEASINQQGEGNSAVIKQETGK